MMIAGCRHGEGDIRFLARADRVSTDDLELLVLRSWLFVPKRWLLRLDEEASSELALRAAIASPAVPAGSTVGRWRLERKGRRLRNRVPPTSSID